MRRVVMWWIWLTLAAGLEAADVAAAAAHLRKVEALVEAGAASRNALEAARKQLRDARDEQLLADTLYSGNVTLERVPEMLRAAEALRNRAAEALGMQQKLAAEGVVAANTLERPKQDLGHAERQWELARSRARLIEELAEMARREADLAERRNHELALHVEGKGTLTDDDFLRVETAYFEQFSRPLPVSARGSTAVHRSLGFDHRERFDVALNPDQEEGRWLIRLLNRLDVPYIVFRRALAGRSTGAHIHVGLPSPRY